MPKYAMVIVIGSDDSADAWELVTDTLGVEGGRVIVAPDFVGDPWEVEDSDDHDTETLLCQRRNKEI